MSTGEFKLLSGVELCIRIAGSGRTASRVFVLINHNEVSSKFTIAGRFTNLLPGIAMSRENGANDQPETQIELLPQGVAVLTAEAAQ
jgi:hypothetical protein